LLLRDPIHGDVSLSPRETAVLDLPDVQRLRGIKQLGTAYLVYPGCLHTRFDHSLGAAAVAKRLLRELAGRGVPVAPELAEAVAIAALLHDVTHVPFGHTLEDERRLFPRHDKGRRLGMLLDGRLGDGLRRLGVFAPVASILGHLPVADMPAWAAQLVSSTIDADLLDYLRRDSYFAGLAQRYDDRVFHQFVVDDGQLAINLTKHGMERHDARSETEQLLRLRYFLTERVYYHHTKVAAGAMVSKAVELAHEHGVLDEAELLALTDGALFERLRRVPSAATPDPRIVALVDRLEQRRLLKRGYVISARTVGRDERQALIHRFHETRQARREAEAGIAAELGCDASEVVVYCPALTMMKEAAVLVRTPKGLMPLNRYEGEGPSEATALEGSYERLWRFFVFVPEAHAVRTGEVAARRFGFPNEHRIAPE
jgi:HD superfamily phosphohydrolase